MPLGPRGSSPAAGGASRLRKPPRPLAWTHPRRGDSPRSRQSLSLYNAAPRRRSRRPPLSRRASVSPGAAAPGAAGHRQGSGRTPPHGRGHVDGVAAGGCLPAHQEAGAERAGGPGAGAGGRAQECRQRALRGQPHHGALLRPLQPERAILLLVLAAAGGLPPGPGRRRRGPAAQRLLGPGRQAGRLRRLHLLRAGHGAAAAHPRRPRRAAGRRLRAGRLRPPLLLLQRRGALHLPRAALPLRLGAAGRDLPAHRRPPHAAPRHRHRHDPLHGGPGLLPARQGPGVPALEEGGLRRRGGRGPLLALVRPLPLLPRLVDLVHLLPLRRVELQGVTARPAGTGPPAPPSAGRLAPSKAFASLPPERQRWDVSPPPTMLRRVGRVPKRGSARARLPGVLGTGGSVAWGCRVPRGPRGAEPGPHLAPATMPRGRGAGFGARLRLQTAVPCGEKRRRSPAGSPARENGAEKAKKTKPPRFCGKEMVPQAPCSIPSLRRGDRPPAPCQKRGGGQGTPSQLPRRGLTPAPPPRAAGAPASPAPGRHSPAAPAVHSNLLRGHHASRCRNPGCTTEAPLGEGGGDGPAPRAVSGETRRSGQTKAVPALPKPDPEASGASWYLCFTCHRRETHLEHVFFSFLHLLDGVGRSGGQRNTKRDLEKTVGSNFLEINKHGGKLSALPCASLRAPGEQGPARAWAEEGSEGQTLHRAEQRRKPEQISGESPQGGVPARSCELHTAGRHRRPAKDKGRPFSHRLERSQCWKGERSGQINIPAGSGPRSEETPATRGRCKHAGV